MQRSAGWRELLVLGLAFAYLEVFLGSGVSPSLSDPAARTPGAVYLVWVALSSVLLCLLTVFFAMACRRRLPLLQRFDSLAVSGAGVAAVFLVTLFLYKGQTYFSV